MLSWIPVLEDAFRIKAPSISEDSSYKSDGESPSHPKVQQVFEENTGADGDRTEEEQRPVSRTNNESVAATNKEGGPLDGNTREGSSSDNSIDRTFDKTPGRQEGAFSQSFQIVSPCFIEEDMKKDLVELTTLCFELKVYELLQVNNGQHMQQDASCTLTCQFIKDYFFLLDLERLKQCIIASHSSHPQIWETYMEGLKGNQRGEVCVFKCTELFIHLYLNFLVGLQNTENSSMNNASRARETGKYAKLGKWELEKMQTVTA